MFADLVEALVSVLRLVLFAGLCWGAWLSLGQEFLPARSEKSLRFERFATLALLILLLTTFGGLVHAA